MGSVGLDASPRPRADVSSSAWQGPGGIDQPSFDATTFTKNRKRLLEHEVAHEVFAADVRQAKLRRYISSEHFSVDGTLLKAWASHKSFKRKDGPPTQPPDPEARLYRKSNNTTAVLCYSGHLLMENCSALIVEAELITADGYAERATATEMLARLPPRARRRTIAGDKGYGRERNRAWFKITAAVYKLLRITTLDTQPA